jgi:hypothetical protein
MKIEDFDLMVLFRILGINKMIVDVMFYQLK